MRSRSEQAPRAPGGAAPCRASAQALQRAGHFPPGSMGPKIDAAIRFLKNGGKHVIIGDLNQAMEAVGGEAGTHIVCDDA